MDFKNNYYFKNFEAINIVHNEYWDFNLIPDRIGDCFGYATNCKDSCGHNIITDGLVVWFDINQSGTTIDGTSLTSLVQWSSTTILPSSGFTLNDWGLTGVDNGRTDCLSGKTLVITSADTKLVLYPVTGYSITYDSVSGCTINPGQYVYPWFFHSGNTTTDGCPVGNTICLNGGFYQGFFKLDTDKPAPGMVLTDMGCGNSGYTLTTMSATTFWQVMPTEFSVGWSMETWINWSNDYCVCNSGSTGTSFCVSGLTLNDVYPNNKNFFFYIGTRAENKFFNDFSGETGLTTSKGIPLSRTESTDFESNIIDGGQNWFANSNPGILSNSCTCSCSGSGDTSSSITSGMTSNYCDQLSENALGFRITDDGRIGYRKMTVTGDCFNNQFKITGTTMEEGYSESNIIPTGNTWNHIVITYTAGSGSKNGLPSGTLKFWVNGLVKYKVEDFIGLQLRALDEWSDKQIGVPFNLSWGGGTQGLIESQTFGGPDFADRNLLIETNFAGTFEGELSQMRFYEKPLNVLEIRNNFFVDCRRYCRPDTFGGSQTVQPNSEFCGDCRKGPLPTYIITPCD